MKTGGIYDHAIEVLTEKLKELLDEQDARDSVAFGIVEEKMDGLRRAINDLERDVSYDHEYCAEQDRLAQERQRDEAEAWALKNTNY
jgi:hypothetical protein